MKITETTQFVCTQFTVEDGENTYLVTHNEAYDNVFVKEWYVETQDNEEVSLSVYKKIIQFIKSQNNI